MDIIICYKKTKYKNIDIGGDCDNPLQKSNYKNLLVHHKGLHHKRNAY